MVFPIFFNLSLNLVIRSSWSEPQSAPGLVFADCIELLHFGCKEYNQSDFGVDRLVMSMCRVFSCAVGRGCLLWPVHFIGKTLLVFALLHSAFQGQIGLLLQVFLSGEGNGNPLQCSCQENPRDWGAWWAAVCGVAQSRTWLKRLSSSSRELAHTYFQFWEPSCFLTHL